MGFSVTQPLRVICIFRRKINLFLVTFFFYMCRFLEKGFGQTHKTMNSYSMNFEQKHVFDEISQNGILRITAFFEKKKKLVSAFSLFSSLSPLFFSSS